jgi:hypothetical protein
MKMYLLAALAGFGMAFGVGWLAGFSYQTDWLAALVLSVGIYISLQVNELYELVVRSVPGAVEHSRLPAWLKNRIRGD